MTAHTRRLVFISIAGGLLSAGFLLGYHGLLPRPQVDIGFHIPARTADSYIPEASMQPGTEVVFILHRLFEVLLVERP